MSRQRQRFTPLLSAVHSWTWFTPREPASSLLRSPKFSTLLDNQLDDISLRNFMVNKSSNLSYVMKNEFTGDDLSLSESQSHKLTYGKAVAILIDGHGCNSQFQRINGKMIHEKIRQRISRTSHISLHLTSRFKYINEFISNARSNRSTVTYMDITIILANSLCSCLRCGMSKGRPGRL